ncbi:MAG TPA: tetratricopeptide repeat protein [Kiritimatiellia bacterium]|nr:tetratricopeptide repeat protein [Kiritimatiellia bacterium]
MTTLTRLLRFSLSAVIAGWLLGMPSESRASAAKLDEDFEFASRLIDAGFSDFALKMVDEIVRRNPGEADRANLIRAQSMIAARRFAQAEEAIRQLGVSPKADAVRLALGNAYNAAGDLQNARRIYDEFFQRFPQLPTDADVLRFYRDAAYRYGMMLEQAGDIEGAIRSYDRVLRSNPERHVERRLKMDLAGLLIREARTNTGKRNDFLQRAQKYVEEVQWGGIDEWFGHSIVHMANIELMRGNDEKARKAIQDYNDIFVQIDDALERQGLPLAFSPVAGARFLLGELLERQAKALMGQNQRDQALGAYAQALQEFFNVFVRYAESDYGPDAGGKAREIQELIERDFGRRVNIDLAGQETKMAETQFRRAETLFRQRDFEAARDEYLRVLNLYPQTPLSGQALGNLAMSYAHLNDPLMVQVVAGYLAERFRNDERAPVALLALGKHFVDEKEEAKARDIYELYLANFPNHDRAGAILFYLASTSMRAGDDASAAIYLRRIIDDYPQDQFYPRALGQVAWSFHRSGQFEEAAEMFRRVVADTAPSPERATAQFNVADSLMRAGDFAGAATEFRTLIGWLSPAGNPYGATEAARETNAATLERAVFQLANSFARISEPAASVPQLRQQAIRAFDQFVRTYPESELAPRALSGKGTVLLELRQYAEASKTFDELAERYPNSPEGQNALFSLARSAMEIGQFDQAVGAFNRMVADAERYSPNEFLRIGQLMIDNGFANEAIKAFDQVPRDGDRSLVERALFGVARAHQAAGIKAVGEGRQAEAVASFDRAIAAVDDMLEKFPRSGLFFEAKFLIGEAHRDAGRFHEAVEALRDVFNFGQDQAQLDRATMALAAVQRGHGDLVGALASYQRLVLLSDPSKPDLRPKIEEAAVASVEIARELSRWQTVVDAADQYLNIFPQGQHVAAMRRARGEAILRLAEQ